MTADEIVFARGKYNTNALVWYYFNAASTPRCIYESNYWWTMSQHSWNNSRSSVLIVMGGTYNYEARKIKETFSNDSYADIHPVISLKSNVLWNSGTGEPTNPFEVKLSD